MILTTMWRRYKNLTYIKNGLLDKGYNFKSLSYLNSQIEILNTLIKEESKDILNRLLFEKTNVRLFNKIEKGEEYLVDIYNHKDQWYLCNIEESSDGWLDKDSLIFSTEDYKTFIFTKINCGQKYTSNKWQ